MPKHGANRYGDRFFTAMMISKVICVQLVNMLGYDVLFQDVDIVWWRDPMEYFNALDKEKFDIYFQDDGAYQIHYVPLSFKSYFHHKNLSSFFAIVHLGQRHKKKRNRRNVTFAIELLIDIRDHYYSYLFFKRKILQNFLQ